MRMHMFYKGVCQKCLSRDLKYLRFRKRKSLHLVRDIWEGLYEGERSGDGLWVTEFSKERGSGKREPGRLTLCINF